MLRLSPTMSLYLGRQFAIGFAIAIGVLSVLIFLVDLVELARRAAGSDQAGFRVVLEMGILHLPYLVQRIVPYAVLIGVMLSLSRLTRKQELVVMRGAGVSVWQFLAPAIGLALAMGMILVAVINPLASSMLSRYEQIDAKYIRQQAASLAVSTSGLWLRQVEGEDEAVIHALALSQPGLVLKGVTIFRYAGRDRFVERIDADSASLEQGEWQLRQALITSPDHPPERRARHSFPTRLTISQIQDSFASPETLSFWELPNFIRLLDRAGFSSLKHRVHWLSELVSPLLLCGMVLIAAGFSLRLTRRGGTGWLMSAGVAVGFSIYVFSDIVRALGLSSNLPVLLAGWAPAVASALFGLALLLYSAES